MRSIGLDLTDAYARQPRAVDIAILHADMRCELLTAPAHDVFRAGAPWLPAFVSGPASDDVLVIDGPLGLATPPNGTREAERALGTPGHTPHVLPVPGTRPFAGYLRSAVELAQRLHQAGWRLLLDAPAKANAFEAYPGHTWRVLAGGSLPSKATAAGIAARSHLLSALGVRFSRAPRSHDELDAALCAWLGMMVRASPGRVRSVGLPTSVDTSGTLREGVIITAATSAATMSGAAHVAVAPAPPPPAPTPPPPEPLSMASGAAGETLEDFAEWVYFATPARAGDTETAELAMRDGLICRTVYTSDGSARIPGVQHVRPGDRVLLAYGSRRVYFIVARFVVLAPEDPVVGAPAIHRVTNKNLGQRLERLGYMPDARLRCFTALLVEMDWSPADGERLRVARPSMNTIHRGAAVGVSRVAA